MRPEQRTEASKSNFPSKTLIGQHVTVDQCCLDAKGASANRKDHQMPKVYIYLHVSSGGLVNQIETIKKEEFSAHFLFLLL
jgi:hypothetical protein